METSSELKGPPVGLTDLMQKIKQKGKKIRSGEDDREELKMEIRLNRNDE